MVIRKARYRKVKVIQLREVSPEVHGCDYCKKEIKNHPNETGRLEITVFRNDSGNETSNHHLCSWKCVLKFIPTISSDYFATLPYLYFDGEATKGRGAKDLIKLLTE